MGFFDGLVLSGLFDAFDGAGEEDVEPTSADVASAAIALESFSRAMTPEHEDPVQLARARWIDTNRASESFGCGIAPVPEPATPDPWHERFEPIVPVTVMVTATEFVFLREGIEGVDLDPLVEAGRFDRSAFVEAVVVGPGGGAIAEPIEEIFEPSAPRRLVVRWTGPDGAADEDAFAFRSAWVAAEAARRFRRAAGTSGDVASRR